MDTRVGLTDLPEDVLERVLCLLSVGDIGALRQVCKGLANKASRSVYRTFFTSHHLAYESPEQLRALEFAAQPGRLGGLLAHLAVVGQVPTPPPTGNAEEHALSLAKALENVTLTSLTLTVHDARPPDPTMQMHAAQRKPLNDWRPIWQCAARTFAWGIAVLAASSVNIQELDIFHSSTACSLAIDQLGPARENLEARPLHDVRHLSMSLSGPIVSGNQGTHGQPEDAAERHIGYAGRFVNVLCPSIQSLDLHWYSLRTHNLSPAQQVERNFFQAIANFRRSESLQRVSLERLFTTQAALVAFAGNNKALSSIAMKEIHLHDGSRFKPLFEYLISSGNMGNLQQVDLDDLFEDDKLVCFRTSGKPHAPTTDERDGPNDLHVSGTALRRPIRYTLQKGVMMGSIQATNWAKSRRMQFGPPADSLQ